MVWCPEQLLQCMLAHIHYMPDHWRGTANKGETRDEVAQLFQYKAVRMQTYLSYSKLKSWMCFSSTLSIWRVQMVKSLYVLINSKELKVYSIYFLVWEDKMFFVSFKSGFHLGGVTQSHRHTLHSHLSFEKQVSRNHWLLQELYCGGGGSWRHLFLCTDGHQTPWKPNSEAFSFSDTPIWYMSEIDF